MRHPRGPVGDPSRPIQWALVAANWILAAFAGFWGVLIVSSGTVDIGLRGAAVAALVTGLIPVVHRVLVDRHSTVAVTPVGS